MLRKARDYITYGEISKEIITMMIESKGRIAGDRKLTDEYAQKVGKKSLDELAEALSKGEVEFRSLPNIKPIFRLHPPSRGFKGKVKRSYASGGATGYRGEAINKLLEQMI